MALHPNRPPGLPLCKPSSRREPSVRKGPSAPVGRGIWLNLISQLSSLISQRGGSPPGTSLHETRCTAPVCCATPCKRSLHPLRGVVHPLHGAVLPAVRGCVPPVFFKVSSL